MKRPCLDCGTLIGSGSRCRSCRAVVERRRGTPAQRGYGRDHYRARALLAETLPDTCGYCGRLVAPESRWVAAHVVDGDPTAGWMVAHGACNERAKVRGAGGNWGASSLVPAPPRAYSADGLSRSSRRDP